MNKLLFLLALIIAIVSAQLPALANHQIGVHPGDTPEVAAAKAQHLKAYRDALAVLPELPPEERYRKHGLPLPAVLALQQQARDQFNVQQLHHVHQPAIHTALPTFPTLLAEDIPRSPIGEVPEVHAARVAHLKAVQEVRAALSHS